MAAAVELPLIVIVGPTASGKTAMAIRLAQAFNGEIVCADSRTVYKGLDIGTAKPTRLERRLVAHHLLDVVLPHEQYNVARFQKDARKAIEEIRRRGKIPFLVGGSGLYIDSVLFSYGFGSPPDHDRRSALEAETIEQLYHYSKLHNINLPNNLHNKRSVIRAIEQQGINTTRNTTPIDNSFIVGITTDSETLKRRMTVRARAMFTDGVLAEAEKLSIAYGWEMSPLQAPVYRLSRALLEHTIDRDEAIDQLSRSDWQLARKQLTWFRRNPYVTWLPLDDVERAMHSFIAQNRATIESGKHSNIMDAQ